MVFNLIILRSFIGKIGIFDKKILPPKNVGVSFGLVDDSFSAKPFGAFFFTLIHYPTPKFIFLSGP